MKVRRAPIDPVVLRWARESAGMELEEAAHGIGVSEARLASVEDGDGQLTLNQAREAAKTYSRPFAVLFLPEPPDEEPNEVQFRRLRDAPPLPWPPQMRALARRIPALQEDADAIFDAIEELPAWRGGAEIFRLRASVAALAENLRGFVGVTVDEQKAAARIDQAGYRTYRVWREAIEDLGILVLQDGTLPVADMRGFAAPHDSVPAIVINTNDDVRARLFTLIHELAHLFWADATEDQLEQLSSATLMPQPSFQVDFMRTSGTLLERIDRLARFYGTTPDATAVRLGWLDLQRWPEVNAARTEIRRRGGDGRQIDGGNYYRNVISRYGPGFVRRVIGAVDQSAVSELAAARMLGVRVTSFTGIRKEIGKADG